MNHVTAYFDGNGLLIDKDVANELNIKDGYTIKNSNEFWKIIKENASMSLAKIAIERAKNG